jgi:hypothetical protein
MFRDQHQEAKKRFPKKIESSAFPERYPYKKPLFIVFLLINPKKCPF